MILISVIIPCYNVAYFLEDCLESVLNQTYNYLEILLIDNNSNDDTIKIMSSYVKRYPNQISMYCVKNQGATHARNLGIEKSKGEWIQFLDADDLLSPEKINHQVSLIDENTDVIYGSSYKETVKGNQYLMPITEDIVEGLFATKLGNTCSNLFKKQKLEEIGGWNVDLKSSQEYDLMMRLFMISAKFKIDLEPLTIIREREFGQISNHNSKWTNYTDIRIRFYLYLKNSKYTLSKTHYKAISNALLLSSRYYKRETLKHLFNNLSLLLHMNIKTLLALIYNLSINKN
ncbi:glycosyltransferase [Bacteroidota bacterium]|nr:glycosyltransferase [Bacteroidota bacterium]